MARSKLIHSLKSKISTDRDKFYLRLRAVLPQAIGDRCSAFPVLCSVCCGIIFSLLTASCNKSSGVKENKAFVTVTHVAPGFSALNILSDGDSILGNLAYGQTSGVPENPYVEATAGVRKLQVTEGSETVLEGNTAFQQGLHYSIFAYDSLKNDSLKLFILQDNVQIRTDTFTYTRFINFSPGSNLNLVLTSKRDTVATGFQPFAGNKLSPSYYSFRILHIGRYAARAFRDTLFANSIPLDSLVVDSTKIYTIFLQGFADSTGGTGLMLKSIRHN
ncbi:MAG TPA: DUF4397 domain-containing protein [Puia sp.]|jgi:hypothetical protein